MPFTCSPAKVTDIGTAATLIARTYLALGAKMVALTGQLRGLPDMQGEYGVLVADEGEQTVGYALFTPIAVGGNAKAAALLAPFAYDATREDIDPNKVLEKSLEYAQQKGYRYVLMHGDLSAHANLGFKDAEKQGLTTTIRYPGTILLIKDFGQGQPEQIVGAVSYPEAVHALA